MTSLLENPFEDEDPVGEIEQPALVGAAVVSGVADQELDSFDFDSEMGGEDFFGD